jgi:hypothetical protein
MTQNYQIGKEYSGSFNQRLEWRLNQMQAALDAINAGSGGSGGIDDSSFAAQVAPGVTSIQNVCDLYVTPALASIIPDAIIDKRPIEFTETLRSNGDQEGNYPRRLRSVIATNYTTSKLFLHIFGNSTPANNAIPDFPPIVMYQDQLVIIGPDILGVDGYGFAECTVRVSSAQLSYVPTATTAGLWQAIVRTKS